MTLTFFRHRALLFLGIAVVLVACSMGPQITRTQSLSETADAPYEKFLVIMLYSKFDVRRQFENAVVKQLSDRGISAVASTSMMDTTTPVTRQTFLAMVEALNADAVVITQVAGLHTTTTTKEMRPEATYNVSATGFYNVWGVELKEYVEPPNLEVEAALVLATQAYSVLTQQAVWAIESNSQVVQEVGRPGYYPFFVDEAKAITSHLSRDGLIAQ